MNTKCRISSKLRPVAHNLTTVLKSINIARPPVTLTHTPYSIQKRMTYNHHSSIPVCLTTGPLPLPKRFLHTVRSSPSSFNFQYPLFSLRSSSSCLRLIPRIPLTSSLYLSCNVFQNAVPMQAVTNPVTLPSFYCMYDLPLLFDCT
jgi:hypothetical protein